MQRGETESGKSGTVMRHGSVTSLINAECNKKEEKKMESEFQTGFFTQAESKVNGRGVWHYMIATPIGNFNIVEYEQVSKELKRFMFDGWYEKAEKKYQSIILGIAKGTI